MQSFVAWVICFLLAWILSRKLVLVHPESGAVSSCIFNRSSGFWRYTLNIRPGRTVLVESGTKFPEGLARIPVYVKGTLSPMFPQDVSFPDKFIHDAGMLMLCLVLLTVSIPSTYLYNLLLCLNFILIWAILQVCKVVKVVLTLKQVQGKVVQLFSLDNKDFCVVEVDKFQFSMSIPKHHAKLSEGDIVEIYQSHYYNFFEEGVNFWMIGVSAKVSLVLLLFIVMIIL